MKLLKLLFLVIFLGVLAFTLSDFLMIVAPPHYNLQSIRANVSFRGEIDLSAMNDSAIDWLVLRTGNLPQDNFNQRRLSFGASEPYEFEEDEFGNTIIVINFSNPRVGINRYSMWSIVEVERTEFEELPTQGDTVPSYALEATEKVQSESEEIQQAAEELFSGTLRQGTARVYEMLTYDLSYAGEVKDALWVLENKEGVCVEFAHLELALLRAQDVPAKHIYGVAPYEELSGWQEHAWVEAFVESKWMMQDPTWGRKDFVDAAHIKLTELPDHSYAEEGVRARGIEVKLLGMSQPEINVEILDAVRDTKSEALKRNAEWLWNDFVGRT